MEQQQQQQQYMYVEDAALVNQVAKAMTVCYYRGVYHSKHTSEVDGTISAGLALSLEPLIAAKVKDNWMSWIDAAKAYLNMANA